MLLSSNNILFLDLDGVLHPDEVFWTKKSLILRAEGEIMMHANLLIDAIKPLDVSIIISSSWVKFLGYSRTLKKLPLEIKSLVIGATYHSGMAYNQDSSPYSDHSIDEFSRMTRFQQIDQFINRHQVKHWVAIDDLHSGSQTWPASFEKNLVLTDGQKGLNDSKIIQDLHQKLQENFNNTQMKKYPQSS